MAPVDRDGQVVPDRRRRSRRHGDPRRSDRVGRLRLAAGEGVAHAPTRAQAAHTLARALRSSQVSGVRTNIEAMANVLLEADFLAAATPTAYLDEHPATMVRGRIEPADDDVAPARSDGVALLLAAVFAREQADREIDPVLGFAPSGWRNLRTQGQREIWIDWATGDEHPVEFVFNGRDRAVVMLGPWPHPGPDGAMSADDRAPLAGPVAVPFRDATGDRGRRYAFSGRRPSSARSLDHGDHARRGRGPVPHRCRNVRARAGVRSARRRRRRERADFAASWHRDRRARQRRRRASPRAS